MKNILERFLDALEVRYTKRYADNLYDEHPHRDNMYGLKRMLDVYGVKTQGVRLEDKDLACLNYPCILHTDHEFVIGLECDTDGITYLQHGEKATTGREAFKQTWSGNALVVSETTEAAEPDYREHRRDEWIALAERYAIPVLLALAAAIGVAGHLRDMDMLDLARIALSSVGILVCCLLMEKQLSGQSRYGDRVCSLFRRADCNSVLDGPMAKVFGISWSEVGLGYFAAGILLLSLYPASSGPVAAINWMAMLYGVWSVYYQWRVAKSWCVLCVIVQAVIWAMGITAIFSALSESLVFDVAGILLSCITFAVCIMAVHQYASAGAVEKERVHAVRQYRALKADSTVAQALIGKGEYHETTLDDSSVIFGNPGAEMRVTILSNPHCNPCARMHERVERLLGIAGDEICVQYIFSSFNESLEDSSRYLIACYFNNPENEARRKFSLWYAKDKFDYKRIMKENEAGIHTQVIEEEMERHRKWREKTSLIVTPTVLVNGHKLPEGYELEDLAMIDSMVLTEKNILQDINGRSTTPLGAESQSAEETV